MPQVIHIDGLSTEPVGHISIAPGTGLRELVEGWGGTISYSYTPDPTPLQRLAERKAKVGKRVSELLREYDSWNDLPSPWFEHERGDCIECDALRIVDGMLD